MQAEVARARELTSKPIGVNLLLFGNEALIEPVLELEPAVFSTAWPRDDQDLAAIFTLAHEPGAKVMHMVVSLPDAVAAVEAGADVVVAQGTEGGGHVGTIGTTVLVRQVPKAVASVPVLAAGGLADGGGLAAALALGADGVLLGTRFMATEGCALTPFDKRGSSRRTPRTRSSRRSTTR
jgi:NAD(P)H-dependent flavin oxidoreductase YrpB (nitropropane dioxygenase family)